MPLISVLILSPVHACIHRIVSCENFQQYMLCSSLSCVLHSPPISPFNQPIMFGEEFELLLSSRLCSRKAVTAPRPGRTSRTGEWVSAPDIYVCFSFGYGTKFYRVTSSVEHVVDDGGGGGETMSLTCCHQLAYCSSTRWDTRIWAWRAMVEWHRQGKFLICPPELCVKQEELGKEIMDCALRSVSFILRRDLQHAGKSYDVVPTALLRLWRKAYSGFVSPSAGFWSRELWVQWQAR
jgi:hypothetical protein